MTNKNICILSTICKSAGKEDKCHNACGYFVGLHGGGSGGRIAQANVPKEFRLCTIKNSPVRETQPRAYKLLDNYETTFTRQFEQSDKRIKSIYLSGRDVGTGKTTTACAILNSFIISNYLGSLKRKQKPLQHPAYFVSTNALQKLYNSMIRPGSPEKKAEFGDSYEEELEIMRTVPMLVLDDIATRSYTEAFLFDVHEIISYRLNEGLITVYTSNVGLDELKQVFRVHDEYGRTFDRIRDQCIEIEYTGDSKRGLR